MKKRLYSIVALVMALLFWFMDALIHYFVYGESQFEIIPSDNNELWMRLVIVLLLLVLGIYADLSSKKLMMKEKQLEAARIYKSMLYASHHIQNNLLNQMQLFKMEALRCDDFDRKIIKLYDDAFNEAADLIQRLSEVEDITEENIWSSVDPDNTANSIK